MNIEQRVQILEEELKMLKNDVKPMLLDIREQYLNMQNPFNDSISMFGNSSNQADTNNLNEERPDKNSPDTTPTDQRKDNSPAPTEEEQQFDDNESSTETPREFDSPGFEPDYNNYSMNKQNLFDKKPVTRSPENPEISQRRFYNPNTTHKGDLIMIAGLTHWIEEATLTLGKERVEALMEMTCAMGRISTELKDVIIKLARLSKYEDAVTHPITSRDYLALLTQLENLLGQTQPNEAALLSILSLMKESVSG